eukprot:353590-Chlamydomonas_euryale.AAC.2
MDISASTRCATASRRGGRYGQMARPRGRQGALAAHRALLVRCRGGNAGSTGGARLEGGWRGGKSLA